MPDKGCYIAGLNIVKSAGWAREKGNGGVCLTLAQDPKLLKRAYAPAKLAMKYHPLYHGKIEIAPKVPVSSYEDFAVWYTPGVANPHRDIQKNLGNVFDYTNKAVLLISHSRRTTELLMSKGLIKSLLGYWPRGKIRRKNTK